MSVESAAGSNQVSDLLDGGEGVGNAAFERRLYVFLDPLKTFSVDGAAAEFPDSFPVSPGRIAFVFWKIELRIVMMVFLHQTVTGDFGDDRGCGNRDA